jgi:hypothetical protein
MNSEHYVRPTFPATVSVGQDKIRSSICEKKREKRGERERDATSPARSVGGGKSRDDKDPTEASLGQWIAFRRSPHLCLGWIAVATLIGER